ncbi:biotin--[acetyl-CoA-carboxylase] ligase [Ilumatobacter nonamiensis]|uniref:biotin--[acetyl-CoA-carboxylase] ligase n=1 Tax=Ilumatobacter nonamiensis TaxID=467093 RepID=UPI00034AA137|nr:biotin--[acetyl-CoA-carboxylase] ligase [Ilumatobacter nonamiensis]
MTDFAGIWTIEHVAETGSTNADLIERADSGAAADRTVLRTDHQTAGRGRLDRRWDAPPGTNLLTSILFTDPPSVPTELPQAVAVASLTAVEELAGRGLDGRLELKWPNDLLLDGRKLSGVLSQRTVSGAVVVGIGLNVGWAPEGAACLRDDLDLDTDPATFLECLLSALDEILASGDVVARYRERLSTLGLDVRIELPGGTTLTAVAVDLDEGGRLIVESSESGRMTLDVGDIVHLRPG